MLTPEVIQQAIELDPEISHVEVSGDGYHFKARIVSDAFEGCSRVQRQQKVYAKLRSLIASGELHAISMQTWTQAEWEKQNG